MIHIILFLISIFWAMNMGASNFAVSFSPSYGANIIKKKFAVILFSIFLIIGALLVGGRVVKTLSGNIVPQEFITQNVALIILTSSTISLFTANILKIPQSTSIIIVSSIIAVGIYFNSLNILFITNLFIIWIIISLLSYFVTYKITKIIYPPRETNLWLYEKFFRHENLLKKWTLYTDCYSAFACGTNNVANVVGPLVSAGILTPNLGLLLFAPVFGLGGLVLGNRVLETTGKEVIPLGIITSSVVSLVVSSFIILCSLLGLPAPYIQFSAMTVLAIHTVKEEKTHIATLNHDITKKIFKVWTLTPVLSFVITYLLLKVFVN